MICNTVKHVFPIALPRGMYGQEKETAPHYGTHNSDHKEAEFIEAEIADQIQAGHMDVFPLNAVMALPNLWCSPLMVIPQVGQRPRLIFYFTWSGMNKSTKHLAPMEAIRFGGTLHHILQQVLTVNQ